MPPNGPACTKLYSRAEQGYYKLCTFEGQQWSPLQDRKGLPGETRSFSHWFLECDNQQAYL